MPPGLAMSILAANNQVKDTRDDIALLKTLKAIKCALDKEFKCEVPAAPNDDIFEDFNEEKKSAIKNYLTNFIADAEKAVLEPNQLKASNLWRKHLGERFPLGENKDDENLNKKFEGGRPSSIIIGEKLDPKALGALLSHFENKIMFQGFVWNLNSFDQEGVQLGKVLAKKVLAHDTDGALKVYSELLNI